VSDQPRGSKLARFDPLHTPWVADISYEIIHVHEFQNEGSMRRGHHEIEGFSNTTDWVMNLYRFFR